MVGGSKLFRCGIHIIMVILSLCCILPFVLLIMASITDEATLTLYGYSFFPKAFGFDAYTYLGRSAAKIVRAYGMTIFVTVA